MNALLLSLALIAPSAEPAKTPPEGSVPVGKDGKPLNLGFETGTLKDWTATGEAFADQPIEGDTVAKRRGDMTSGHRGKFWIGGFEKHADKPTGTLTSEPFKVTHPWATFLIAGGNHPKECSVELVDVAKKEVFFRATGEESETLKAVLVDLSKQAGKEIQIRLVDTHTGHWGHLNFDDFRFHSQKPSVPARTNELMADAYPFAGQKPQDAAKNMTVLKDFRVKLFAGEPDIHQPIAMCTDDRGRVWVVEAFTYPKRHPEKGPVIPDAKLGDKILILEDTDGDGVHDKRTVFFEGLNLASGIENGFGGVWVGAAPYMLFIPILEGDKAGEPKILLDGWGYEDTHETLNSFLWGPDGWLYGCHGVFTHSNVGKPGAKDAERQRINAGVWRYHPTNHSFEVFAHGTSNPWGLDYNDKGDFFVEACVIPHLWHIVQGGRYERQAGSHFNPFTYDAEIKTIAKHRHFVGGQWNDGDRAKSSDLGGGHAHSGLLIYQGGLWPKEYRGKLLMGNIHGHRINVDEIKPKGSSYEGDRNPDFLLSKDKHCIIVGLQATPDGNMIFSDWSDKQVCHRNEPEIWDRTNGRLFKVEYKDTKPVKNLNLQKLSDAELVKLQTSDNQWMVRHARRILQERGSIRESKASEEDLTTARGRRLAISTRLHANQYGPSKANLAAGELQKLFGHAEDTSDPLIPHLAWYLLESQMPDAELVLNAAFNAKIGGLLAKAARRLGEAGESRILLNNLDRAETDVQQLAMLGGLEESLKTRKVPVVPKAWKQSAAKLAKSESAQVRSRIRALSARFGDKESIGELRKELADAKVPSAQRRDSLAILLGIKDDQLLEPLGKIISTDGELRLDAIRAFAQLSESAEVPKRLLASFKAYDAAAKREAIAVLASRATYATALMAAVGDKTIPAADIPAETIRQLRSFNDKALSAKIVDAWGTVRDTPADRKKLIADWGKKLAAAELAKADLGRGRALFNKVCAQCHVLYGAGGKVGPEITGANRSDLNYLLENVFDPSAVIPKEYAATKFDFLDGRSVIGFAKAETATSVTIQTANELLVVSAKDIDKRTPSDQSMMPNDLTAPLSESQIRDLFAYLKHDRPVPPLLNAETAKEFFNGKDLTNWEGDRAVWSVVDGAIVGKTAKGLAANNFLVSAFDATDFKLTLKVKLSPNTENSGIQFRSVPIEKGEMRGPQADIGEGWWGKLYEESARGLLVKNDNDKLVKKDDWNDYVIEAIGPKVKMWLNGKLVCELDDDKLARRGRIAVQVHSGGPTDVRFKDIAIEVIEKK